MFSFQLSEADKEAWKSGTDRVLLSESFAKANFPGTDPLGQILLRYGRELTVAGTYKDIDNSVIKPADVIVRGEQMEEENRSNSSSMNNAAASICFVMAYQGTDFKAKEGDILDLAVKDDIVEKSGAWYAYGGSGLAQRHLFPRLQPLRPYRKPSARRPFGSGNPARRVSAAAAFLSAQLCQHDHGPLRLPGQGDGDTQAGGCEQG